MFRHPHKRVAISTGSFTHTKQSCKDECDIHKILAQYKKTGILTHINSARPNYTDLPSSSDYQSALNTIIEAENVFSDLPAVVRDRFGNDPEKFLAAFADPKMREELTELGLLKRPPGAPEPVRVRIDEPAPTPLAKPKEGPPAAP